MRKTIITTIYILLALLLLKFSYNLISNSILIKKYNDGVYNESQAKALTKTTLIQSYISHYNYGNILYQNGEYEEAIAEYEKALKGNIPKGKECNIRINYALAICKTVKLNEEDKNSIEEAIRIYESAIDVLTEDGCANKDDNNGHSAKAEKLKKDIQDEIDRLKKLLNNKDEDDPDKDKDKDKDKDEPQKEDPDEEKIKEIEETIQEIKEDATNDQREIEKTYDNFNKDFNRREKNW